MMRLAPLLAILVAVCGVGGGAHGTEWWQTMSLYQIYPRSYKDTNGDGIGDLKGIISKLDHLVESNVDAFWLSPIYPSPMVDFGYDIADFKDIDPVYGNMHDFDNLVQAARKRSLKVIMDLVPNHSSDKHEWFQKSLHMIEPYTDYYMWHKGKVLEDGSVTVPNNWVSVFGGSAWTWREERQAYYFHQFAPEQPDLNYNNENVIREIKDIMRFWMDKGVEGFRIDAVPHLCEDDRLLDEPLSNGTNDPNNYGYTEKVYTKDQPRTYVIVRGWREVLDEYTEKTGVPKIMMIEAYTNVSLTMKYYLYGAHFPFNFGMITELDKNYNAADFKGMIDRWTLNLPPRTTSNWVAGNHDTPRLVTRYGPAKARAGILMTMLLPGVGVTYMGDEIGMDNTWISWEDTKDPQGCNAGRKGYEASSRDPARTPFQWDNSTSAGFSTNQRTWLPVNDNYKTLNLAAQKNDPHSYYAFYEAASILRKCPAIRKGELKTQLLSDNVLMFSRTTKSEGSVYVIINFADREEFVDLSKIRRLPKQLTLYLCSISPHDLPAKITEDQIRILKIPASASLIYIGGTD